MKEFSLQRESVYAGNLILVNAQFPIHEAAEKRPRVPVTSLEPPVLCDQEAVGRLSALMMELDGWRFITPVSGWRSMREQQDLYAQSLRDNGAEFTRKFVALPGHSEHQTGLAIDLGLSKPDIDLIRPDFPYTGICQAFRKRAPAFGFVERYPAGKESITGIAQEPWHFRYVGSPHAEIMQSKGLTLEEYHAFIKEFPLGGKPLVWQAGRFEYDLFYIAEKSGMATRFALDTDGPCMVSGDNESGFIATLWREPVA